MPSFLRIRRGRPSLPRPALPGSLSSAVSVLGRAAATAALQVLVLLAGTAALLATILGTLWLSG